MRIELLSTICLAGWLFGCAGDDPTAVEPFEAPDGSAEPESSPAEAESSSVDAAASGITLDEATEELVFRTGDVELAPGQESYTCFAASLDEDVVIDGFSKGAQGFVHHIQFSRTLVPEPDGFSECDLLFKYTWVPLFLTGAGKSELRLDEGVGHKLAKGTQLVVQLHILNAGSEPVKEPVEIRMHRSSAENPTGVSPYVIGSTKIALEPRQAGQVTNTCTVENPVELVAVFPHMHMKGRKLKVEIGREEDAMAPLYERDPYDFDDQHMENVKYGFAAGDKLRITCDYMNDSDQVAGFGESTHDEMCFLIGFALGDTPAQANCPNLWDGIDLSQFGN